jgi:hypothetical protein
MNPPVPCIHERNAGWKSESIIKERQERKGIGVHLSLFLNVTN